MRQLLLKMEKLLIKQWIIAKIVGVLNVNHVIYDKKRHNTTKSMKIVGYIIWNGLKKSLYVNCISITEDRLLITNN